MKEEKFEFAEGVLRLERGSRTFVEVVLKPGLSVVNAVEFGDRVTFSIEANPPSAKEA